MNYAQYRPASAKRSPDGRSGPGRWQVGAHAVSSTRKPSASRPSGRPACRAAGQPGPEAFGEVLHVPGLALVGAQGRDLARECLGHVHVVVRAVRRRRSRPRERSRRPATPARGARGTRTGYARPGRPRPGPRSPPRGGRDGRSRSWRSSAPGWGTATRSGRTCLITRARSRRRSRVASTRPSG